jgi:hypothetical protein
MHQIADFSRERARLSAARRSSGIFRTLAADAPEYWQAATGAGAGTITI